MRLLLQQENTVEEKELLQLKYNPWGMFLFVFRRGQVECHHTSKRISRFLSALTIYFKMTH